MVAVREVGDQTQRSLKGRPLNLISLRIGQAAHAMAEPHGGAMIKANQKMNQEASIF